MLVMHYIFACRIERRDIYGKRMLASFIAAMTVITVVIGSLYRYPLPRYLLAAVLLAGFVYLMREDIKAMLPAVKGKKDEN